MWTLDDLNFNFYTNTPNLKYEGIIYSLDKKKTKQTTKQAEHFYMN